MAQRDIFITEITKALKSDKKIYFLSADFGAPALDKLKNDYPENFIHCGISEQAMIDMATGLALEGNKVFVYAMAPFLSLRSIEQAKTGPGLMKLPICFISVGVGLSYADAGPTHYSTEDFACFRSIIGCSIYTPYDNNDVKNIAEHLLEKTSFSYVRLDREDLPNIVFSSSGNFERGFRSVGNSFDDKVVVISHGKMVHRCVEAFKNNEKFVCINLIRSKPFPETLHKTIRKCKGVLVVDEQGESGGLASCIFENFNKNDFFPKILNICLPEKYIFDNGGRDYLLDINGLSKKDIINKGKQLL